MKGTGFLLTESLTDPRVLDALPGLRVTERSVIDAADAAGWQPREWHGVAFEIDVEVASAEGEDGVAQTLRRWLRPRWYLNFDTTATRYVVFSDRIFEAPQGDPTAKATASEAAKVHGRALGIPETQLDGC